jgi:hypothetical protein
MGDLPPLAGQRQSASPSPITVDRLRNPVAAQQPGRCLVIGVHSRMIVLVEMAATN